MNVVALRSPQPRLDGKVVAKMTFIRPGWFEALGDGGKWMQGRLAGHRIPHWATRVHISHQDFSALSDVFRPDDEFGDGQASPRSSTDAPAETVVPAGAVPPERFA